MATIPGSPIIDSRLALYFRDANPAEPENSSEKAKILLGDFGFMSIHAGFLWVVRYLQSIKPRMVGIEFNILKKTIIDEGLIKMSQMYDLVWGVTAEASSMNLTSVIRGAENEDVKTLAAYTLAAPKYADRLMVSYLEEEFLQVVGTGCRMAIALALCMCGSNEYLKLFIENGALGDIDYFNKMKRDMQQNTSKSSDEEIEKSLILFHAAPELVMGPIPSTHPLYSLLFMDIASDGAAIQVVKPGAPPWVRKH